MSVKQPTALPDRRGSEHRDVDHAAAAHAFFSDGIAVPQPVTPPPMVANDPLAEMYVPVERELKRAGYLR